jgi:hypothetical protein
MQAYKTFNTTGIAPNGVLYAGDLNAIQALVAALEDFTQTIQLANLQIGDDTIQLAKYGTGVAWLSAGLRVSDVLTGLGGLLAGTYTTSQMDAISLPPTGLIVLNTTLNQYMCNYGTPGSPNWQPLVSSVSLPRVCVVHNTSTSGEQAIPSSTDTQITFDAGPVIDTSGFFNSSSNEFVIPSGFAGDYLITGEIEWSANYITGSVRACSLWHSGVQLDNDECPPPSQGVSVHSRCTAMVTLAVDDTIQLHGYQDSGDTLDVYGVQALQSVSLKMVKIG